MSTMTVNYNEKIQNSVNLASLKAIVAEINSNIDDNIEFTFDMAKLEKSVAKINEEFKNDFSDAFILWLDTDRKTAFERLVKTPNYTKVIIEVSENGKITLNDSKKSLFKFSDLETALQLARSTETDKNGHKIKNKSVTVFGALRFYGLCDCFIRNLFTTNLIIDNDKIYDLSKSLIELSGLTLGKDIEIEITGLRPGEKLYEELLMNEENLEETNHEKIFITEPMNFTMDDVEVKLEDFREIIDKEINDKQLIKDTIKKHVPTYREPEEVNGE